MTAPPKQEIYGLDVEFLKELNLGDMIHDIFPASSSQGAQQSSHPSTDKKDGGPSSYSENQNNRCIDDLREEYEIKKSAPKKLRATCKNYRNEKGKMRQESQEDTFDREDDEVADRE